MTASRTKRDKQMTYQVIRKNATKKIEALLSKATAITKRTEYRDCYTDCFESVSTKSDIAEVREYMAEVYGDLRLVLELDSDGNETGLRISVNGWSKKEFFIDFTEQEQEKELEAIEVIEVEAIEKPKMTLKMVQAYLSRGFVSPLNTGARIEDEAEEDQDKIIKKIFLHWSESNAFDGFEGKEISFEEYAKCEWKALSRQRGRDYGYDKTKVTLTLASGIEVEFRHDISLKERGLSAQWCNHVDYVKQA